LLRSSQPPGGGVCQPDKAKAGPDVAAMLRSVGGTICPARITTMG
jgi:hypothetical protein